MERNGLLDLGGGNFKSFEFRERQPEKEIQPDMHFANRSPYTAKKKEQGSPGLNQTLESSSPPKKKLNRTFGGFGSFETEARGPKKEKEKMSQSPVNRTHQQPKGFNLTNASFGNNGEFEEPKKFYFKSIESFSLRLPDSVTRLGQSFDNGKKQKRKDLSPKAETFEENMKEMRNMDKFSEALKESSKRKSIERSNRANSKKDSIQSNGGEDSLVEMNIADHQGGLKDPFQKSQVVLEKFQVNKKRKASFLKMGQGKYLSDPKVSMEVSYNRVLPRLNRKISNN